MKFISRGLPGRCDLQTSQFAATTGVCCKYPGLFCKHCSLLQSLKFLQMFQFCCKRQPLLKMQTSKLLHILQFAVVIEILQTFQFVLNVDFFAIIRACCNPYSMLYHMEFNANMEFVCYHSSGHLHRWRKHFPVVRQPLQEECARHHPQV